MSTVEDDDRSHLKSAAVTSNDEVAPVSSGNGITSTSAVCTNVQGNDHIGETYNINIDRIRVLFPSLNRGQKSLLLTAVREEQNLKNKLRELQLESGELDYERSNDKKDGSKGRVINILSPDSGKLTPPWVTDIGRENDDDITSATLNNGELLGLVLAQLSYAILLFYSDEGDTVRGSIEGEWSGGVRGDGKVQIEPSDKDQMKTLGRFTLVLKNRPTKRQRQKCSAAKNENANKERVVKTETGGVKKEQLSDCEINTVTADNTSTGVIKRKKADCTIERRKDEIPIRRSVHPVGEKDTQSGTDPVIVFSDEMIAVAAVVVLGKHDHFVTSSRDSTGARAIKRIATPDQLARIMAGDKKRQLEQQSRRMENPNDNGVVNTNVFIDFQQRHQQEIHIKQQCHHYRINPTSAMYVAMNSVLLAPKTKSNILSQNDTPIPIVKSRVSKFEDASNSSSARGQQWAIRQPMDIPAVGYNVGLRGHHHSTKDAVMDPYNKFPRWPATQPCYFYQGKRSYSHHHHCQHHQSLPVPIASNRYPLPPYGTGIQDFSQQPFLKSTAVPFVSYSVGCQGSIPSHRNMSNCDSSSQFLQDDGISVDGFPIPNSQIWGHEPVASDRTTIINNTDMHLITGKSRKISSIGSIGNQNSTLATHDVGVIGMYSNNLWGAPMGSSIGSGSEQEELEELKAVLSSLLQEGLDLNQVDDEEKPCDILLSAESGIIPATMESFEETKLEQNVFGSVGDGASVTSTRAAVGSPIAGRSDTFSSVPDSPSTTATMDEYGSWSVAATGSAPNSLRQSLQTSFSDNYFISDENWQNEKLPHEFIEDSFPSSSSSVMGDIDVDPSTLHTAIVVQENRGRVVSATGKALKKLFMSIIRGKRTVLRLKRSGDSLFADVVSANQLSHLASQRHMMEQLMESCKRAYSQQKMIEAPTFNESGECGGVVTGECGDKCNINGYNHISVTGTNSLHGATVAGEHNIFLGNGLKGVGAYTSDNKADDSEEEERMLMGRALHTVNRTLLKQVNEKNETGVYVSSVSPIMDLKLSPNNTQNDNETSLQKVGVDAVYFENTNVENTSGTHVTSCPSRTPPGHTFPLHHQKIQFAFSGFELVVQCDDMPILQLYGKSGEGQKILLQMEELQNQVELIGNSATTNKSNIVLTNDEMDNGIDRSMYSNDVRMAPTVKPSLDSSSGKLRNIKCKAASEESLSRWEILALERWFDAALAKAPYVGVCVHKNGIIRNVELKRSSELLNEIPGVAAKALEAMDTTIDLLKWLVAHCTNERSEYFLVRDGERNDEVVQQIIEERKTNAHSDCGGLCIEKDIYHRKDNNYVHTGKERNDANVSHDGSVDFPFADTPCVRVIPNTTQSLIRTAINNNCSNHNIINDFKLFEIPGD